ncbi:LysR family transcriptional regulator [Alicycliphilus denitrificans]|uniref:LysR family transcriptional regulator n=1 Tax=Alicycliphilus denitrificans TaxID=179636 RepID=UPI00095EF3F2|nr:LysR substrate-binding domain-containing protein [Alicycliphilus denitrificans]OJW90480.1 MAG: LysR family transcriptional regulator [Alicycliphilus sp. 69-12]
MTSRNVTHRMIEAFRAAMLHNGISAGADSLGITQPAMSRLIADLQKSTGILLFAKSGRTIKPTEEAHALMAKVQQSFLGLEQIIDFSDQLRKQKLGQLSISTIPSIGHSIIPAVVRQLREKFPDVLISLRVASYIDVARHVKTRQADIGLTADTLSLGDLETVAEFSSECVCIGTEKWLDPKAGHIHVSEFAGKPFIASTGTFQTRLDAWLGANGVQVDAMVEASLFQSISDLCLEGLGIAVVDPMTAAKHQRRGGVALPLRPAIGYTVYATAMSDARLSAPAKELIRLVAAASSGKHITPMHESMT